MRKVMRPDVGWMEGGGYGVGQDALSFQASPLKPLSKLFIVRV